MNYTPAASNARRTARSLIVMKTGPIYSLLARDGAAWAKPSSKTQASVNTRINWVRFAKRTTILNCIMEYYFSARWCELLGLFA